ILEAPELNEMFRSFYAICEREGKDTNWPAITAKVKAALENPAPIIEVPVNLQNLSETFFPMPDKDLYKKGDADLEEMIWIVNQKRESFVKGWYAALSNIPNQIEVPVEDKFHCEKFDKDTYINDASMKCKIQCDDCALIEQLKPNPIPVQRRK